jgi:hypothetical protein
VVQAKKEVIPNPFLPHHYPDSLALSQEIGVIYVIFRPIPSSSKKYFIFLQSATKFYNELNNIGTLMNNTKRRVSCPQLTKLTLILTLLLGWDSQAWGDDYPIIIVNGGTISDGWKNGWNSNYFDITEDEISATGATAGWISSENLITIGDGLRLVINAKATNSTSATILIKKATEIGKWNYSKVEELGNTLLNSSEGYVKLVSKTLPAGTYSLQITGSYVKINSIELHQDYELTIDEDNPTAFNSASNNIKLNYTPKNGWNTVVMPLGGSYYLSTIFGTGYSAYKLTSYDAGTLSFTKQTGYIGANVPLLIYTTNAQTKPTGGFSLNSVSPSFTLHTAHVTALGTGLPTFQGTYAPKAAGSLTGNYGITSDGMLRKAGSGATMKGYRAYFTGLGAAEARIITIDEDGTTTDLGFVKMVDPEAKDVYNLQGQKVEKGRKGIYVVNGKKVVIK